MHFKKIATLFAGVVLSGSFSFAQPTPTTEPILFQDFEKDNGKWFGSGNNTKVSAATETENIKNGQRALRFDYLVQPGQFQVLASPLAKESFASLQSIKFWVKSSHSTSFRLALQEEGGGYFATVFSVAKDKWQVVEADVDDFLLQTGPGDPKDANGKLDREKIAFIGLIDYDQVALQMISNAPPQVAQLIQVPSGPRTLYLDDVTLSSQALPKTEAATDTTAIDSFERPQAQWASLGGATLERLQANNAKDNALKIVYPQLPGRLVGLIKPIQRGILTGKKQLSFRAASIKPTTFWLQLEEAGGGKYNASFTLPANAVATPIALNFADFKTSPDSNDTNDQLDLEQVKQILIVDISGIMGGAPEAMLPPEMDIPGEETAYDNTLWLNSMLAQ